MEKNVTSKLFKILFLFFICTVGIKTIFGEVGGDVGGGSDFIVEDVSIHGTTWTGHEYTGVRISFVRADGTYLGSVDYVTDSMLDLFDNTHICTTEEQLNRVTYLKQGKDVVFNMNSCEMLGSYTSNVEILENLIVKHGFTAININSKIKDMNLSNLFQPIFDEVNNSHDGQERFKNFLTDMGLENIENYYDPTSGFYDVFLTFELTTIMNLQVNDVLYNQPDIPRQRVRIYGTSYELANEMSKDKYVGGSSYEGCVDSASHGYCDVGTAFRKIACASYITGALENTVVNGISFTNQAYFGGTLKVKLEPNNMQVLCQNSPSSSELSYTTVRGDYGVGIGVAWIGKLLKANDCREVNIAVPNLKSVLNGYYEQGGLQKIYDTYNSKISITSNGVRKEVDLEWYIKECTCYGIYDYYGN